MIMIMMTMPHNVKNVNEVNDDDDVDADNAPQECPPQERATTRAVKIGSAF